MPRSNFLRRSFNTGSSVIPNFIGIQDRGLAAADQVRARELGAEIADFDATQGDRERNLIRLTTIDPVVGNAVRQALVSNDALAISAINQEALKGRTASRIVNSKKTVAEQKKAYLAFLNEQNARGKPIGEDLERLDLTDDEWKLEFLRMEVGANAVLGATEPQAPLTPRGEVNQALARGEITPEQAQARFQEINAAEQRKINTEKRLNAKGDREERDLSLREDKATRDAGKQESLKQSREAGFLLNLPVNEQSLAITQKMQEAQFNNDTETFERMERLLSMSPRNRNIALKDLASEGREVEDILEEGEPQVEFEDEFAGGKLVAQRNKQTNQLTSIPEALLPTGPLSPEAKLEDDFRNNRISKKGFDDARKSDLAKKLGEAGVDVNSPEGKNIMLEILKKPTVSNQFNLNDQIQEGFMWIDPNDKKKGVTPIPGSTSDTLGGEQAAKTQMLRTARKATQGVRKLIFDKVNKDGTVPKDAKVDRINVLSAFMNVPGTEGRELRTKMEFGIQAITRGETGAAMPPEEVNNTRDRFMPQLGDSDETIRLKLDMFDEFLEGALKLIDPQNRFDDERFKTANDKQVQAKVWNELQSDFQKNFDDEFQRRSKDRTVNLRLAPSPSQTTGRIGRFEVEIE